MTGAMFRAAWNIAAMPTPDCRSPAGVATYFTSFAKAFET
jgi:hypothetical protein